MGDVRFNCPACAQPLVTDAKGAGLTINCPHCSGQVQIPFPVSKSAPASKQKSPSKRINRATELDQQLRDTVAQLDETSRLSEQRQLALAETLQQVRVLTSERDALRDKIETGGPDRETFLAQLRGAQTAAVHAQERLALIESDHRRLDARTKELELALSQKHKHLEMSNAERNALLTDFADKNAAIADLGVQFDSARCERDELRDISRRTRDELARVQKELAQLQATHAQLSARFVAKTETLTTTETTLAAMKLERDKLASDVKENHELADFLAVKAARDRIEAELREAQAVLADVREKFTQAASERDTLRHETVELQLKLAALRDSDSDSDLRRANEVLRGIIERLNEELKPPAPRKRKRPKDDPNNSVNDIVRTVFERCFVPDADAT